MSFHSAPRPSPTRQELRPDSLPVVFRRGLKNFPCPSMISAIHRRSNRPIAYRNPRIRSFCFSFRPEPPPAFVPHPKSAIAGLLKNVPAPGAHPFAQKVAASRRTETRSRASTPCDRRKCESPRSRCPPYTATTRLFPLKFFPMQAVQRSLPPLEMPPAYASPAFSALLPSARPHPETQWKYQTSSRLSLHRQREYFL